MSQNRRAVSVALFGAVLVVGGCASQTLSEQEAARIRSDPTPELDTLHQRTSDVDNAIAITVDTNLRSLNQDLGRFWLLDRPSRLTPERIPR